MENRIFNLLLFLILFCSSCQKYKPKTDGGWINVSYESKEQPIFIEFIDNEYVTFGYLDDTSTVFKYKQKKNSLYLENNLLPQPPEIYITDETILMISKYDTIYFKPIEVLYSSIVFNDIVLDSKYYYWKLKTERLSNYNVNVQFLNTGKSVFEYSGPNIIGRSYQLSTWSLIRKKIKGSDSFFLSIKSSHDNLIFLTGIVEHKFEGFFLDSYPTIDKVIFERISSSRFNINGDWAMIDSEESNNYQANIPITLSFSEDVFSFDYQKPVKPGDFFRFGYYESYLSDSLIVLDYLVNNNYGDLLLIESFDNDTLTLGFFSDYSNVPTLAKYRKTR